MTLMRLKRATVLAAVGLASMAACKFPQPPDVESIDAASCTPSLVECDNATSTYTECSSAGTIELQFQCALGCAAEVEKCVEISPANDVSEYLDMARDLSASLDIRFSGMSTFDTATGEVFNGGTPVNVPSALLSGGPRVFMFKGITIPAGVTLKAATSDMKSPGAIFVVGGDVLIEGLLDMSADGTQSGPGIQRDTSCNPLPSMADSSGTCPGGSGAGGYLALGGQGGTSGAGVRGATPGNGGAGAIPLLGGCEGAYASKGGTTVRPGGGGGAIQISSRSVVALRGSGTIDVSGGGAPGAPAATVTCGSGGGSGGAVLLEAPQLVLDGSAVVISTKGGGGAAAGSNAATTRAGADGGYGGDLAAGGTSPGNAGGGTGGLFVDNTEFRAADGQDAPSSSLDGGGGGGASGFVMLRSRSTVRLQNGATIRSRYTEEAVPTRLVP